MRAASGRRIRREWGLSGRWSTAAASSINRGAGEGSLTALTGRVNLPSGLKLQKPGSSDPGMEDYARRDSVISRGFVFSVQLRGPIGPSSRTINRPSPLPQRLPDGERPDECEIPLAWRWPGREGVSSAARVTPESTGTLDSWRFGPSFYGAGESPNEGGTALAPVPHCLFGTVPNWNSSRFAAAVRTGKGSHVLG